MLSNIVLHSVTIGSANAQDFMGGRALHGINAWDSPARFAIVGDKAGRRPSDGTTRVHPEPICAATGSANAPGFMDGKLQLGTSAWDSPVRFETVAGAVVGVAVGASPDKISVRIGIGNARGSTVGGPQLGLHAWDNRVQFMIANDKCR